MLQKGVLVEPELVHGIILMQVQKVSRESINLSQKCHNKRLSSQFEKRDFYPQRSFVSNSLLATWIHILKIQEESSGQGAGSRRRVEI